MRHAGSAESLKGHRVKRALKLIGPAAATAATVYGGYVAFTYLGFARLSSDTEPNPLLDQVMPEYEVRERHSVHVAAPTEITLVAARDISFQDSRIARTIFVAACVAGTAPGCSPRFHRAAAPPR